MKEARFEAFCPVEIGDIVQIGGRPRTVTDIMVLHVVKSNTVKFYYELDGDGNFVGLHFTPSQIRIMTREVP